MLKMEKITKTFNPGTVNEKQVMQGFSIKIDPGEFVTIIGSNGAGKSTLFNLIAGDIFPDSGSIILGGENITWKRSYKRSRSIGRMFQDPLKGTAPRMTVEENLALAYLRTSRAGSAFSQISSKDRKLFTDKLAALGMGLEDRLKNQVGLLSGGQRQALTLLMATLTPPKLLMLDEHTAALDPAAAEKVGEITRGIVAEHGITCLMITHNISEALKHGSRTIMMDGGKIVLDLRGSERDAMTVQDLLSAFKKKASRELDDDRMLLE